MKEYFIFSGAEASPPGIVKYQTNHFESGYFFVGSRGLTLLQRMQSAPTGLISSLMFVCVCVCVCVGVGVFTVVFLPKRHSVYSCLRAYLHPSEFIYICAVKCHLKCVYVV